MANVMPLLAANDHHPYAPNMRRPGPRTGQTPPAGYPRGPNRNDGDGAAANPYMSDAPGHTTMDPIDAFAASAGYPSPHTQVPAPHHVSGTALRPTAYPNGPTPNAGVNPAHSINAPATDLSQENPRYVPQGAMTFPPASDQYYPQQHPAYTPPHSLQQQHQQHAQAPNPTQPPYIPYNPLLDSTVGQPVSDPNIFSATKRRRSSISTPKFGHQKQLPIPTIEKQSHLSSSQPYPNPYTTHPPANVHNTLPSTTVVQSQRYGKFPMPQRAPSSPGWVTSVGAPKYAQGSGDFAPDDPSARRKRIFCCF